MNRDEVVELLAPFVAPAGAFAEPSSSNLLARELGGFLRTQDAARQKARAMLDALSQSGLALAPEVATEEAWPMVNAPKDGTMLRLLVQFTDHALEDTDEPVWTIGSNGLDLGQEDEWVFAGWSWQSDIFTTGQGEVIGWLPFFGSPTNLLQPPSMKGGDKETE